MAVRPVNYEIRIEGHIDSHWSEWLDEMMITPLESGETLLSGPLADQAALFGLLIKLHNLAYLIPIP